MNDEPNDVTKPDEPLAQAVPDPAGPPKPVEKDDDVLRGLSVLGVVLVAGGGLLLPMMASTGSCRARRDRPRSSGSSARPKSTA